MLGGPGTEVGEDREAPRPLQPIDAVDAVPADVRSDDRHQRVHSCSDERHVDRPAERDYPRRESGGERRGVTGRGVDARDLAELSFGDVERAIRSDGCAD